MGFHNALTGTDIHVSYSFTYANQAAREGAAGLTANDNGKIALQSDDNSYWILEDHTGPTWGQVNGSEASANSVLGFVYSAG